jgi:hypothetical protein
MFLRQLCRLKNTLSRVIRGLAPSLNEIHCIPLPLKAKASYPFLPFSSQNQSIGFDFGKEEGGSRAQFSSCLTETERRELLLTQARVFNCETRVAQLIKNES